MHTSDVKERMVGKMVQPIPMGEIAEFCQRWRIRELALFGSVLRGDFGAESDIDVLVTFDRDVGWSLLDHIRMEQELERIFGRDVDLVTKRAVEGSHNWLRRQEILSTARIIFPESRGAYETR